MSKAKAVVGISLSPHSDARGMCVSGPLRPGRQRLLPGWGPASVVSTEKQPVKGANAATPGGAAGTDLGVLEGLWRGVLA